MTPLAANRELYARKEGNGVTGFVAATGQSYVCPDTTQDPLYIEGAAGSRSSLTVPLIIHGTVIGTLNVESPQPDAFDDRDRQFIEIYGRNIAAAINTLELLQAEKVSTASASVEAINRELALPLDDIITDATTVLDRYAGHDEDIIARLRHLLYRAREIRSLIHKAGSTVVPQPKQTRAVPAPRLSGSAALGRRRRRGDPPVGSPPARLPGGQRRDRPRRPRSDRAHAAGSLFGCPGRYPPARPGRLRSVQATSRSPAQCADHPDDRLWMGPDALDREGAPGGTSDGALQAVPGGSPDGRRRTSTCGPPPRFGPHRPRPLPRMVRTQPVQTRPLARQPSASPSNPPVTDHEPRDSHPIEASNHEP